METNENVKDLNEIKDNVNQIEDVKVAENTEKVSDDTIDMQATQRIVLLGDFMQNEGKIISEENNIEISKNIQNSKSDISTESDAQNEHNSNSEQNVQTIPNNETKEPNENSADIVIPKDNDADFKEVTEKIMSKNNSNNIEKNDESAEISEVKEESQEEILKKKKQHAQDKKDYRLERMLFDRINTMQGKIKESLELIKKFERINAKEENLPNIVTTLHDKLTHEVIKQFRTVGIEFNMKSFLVQSVVSDLLGKFEEGITEFKDCSENLNFVREVQEDFESRVELAPTSKVKNLFAKIRGMFKPERKQERLEELERERQEKKLQEANVHLIKYKYINSELEQYTIKNNIVGSVAREMLHGQNNTGLTYTVSGFIDEKIVSEMNKLGLENGIEDLKDKLYTEYREKDETITKEELEQLPMASLRKNMRLQKADVMRSKITQTVNLNNTAKEEEREIG